MSRRNSREAKAARRQERLGKPLPEYRPIRMAICHSCGDQTHVFEPLLYCSRCLDEVE